MTRFNRTFTGRRRLALAEYKKQRRIWTREVAYWIAVWRWGKDYQPMLAVYMLSMLRVSKGEIEYYEQNPPT